MRLEDYINGVKNPPKKPEPEVVFSALDLDSYNTISEAKKSLIKEVFDHLDSESFKSATYRYEHESSEYGYYQSRSNNGLRGLVRILLCYTHGSYDERLERIPQEKFDREYGRCVKAGSQEYTSIQLLRHHDPEEGTSYYSDFYFTNDGRVFIGTGTAEFVASLSEEQLGYMLARKCVEMDEHREKNRQYRLTHPNR